jgi:hypothetical protein
MNLVAKKSIQLAGLLLAFITSQSPAFCQQAVVDRNNSGPAATRSNLQLVATRNNLPPCNLDSFVYQAGAQADMIYGDEGVALPPLFGFTQASRINAGITGQNDAGLTTGHGSYMPDGVGADEFLAPPGEWNLSGTNHGNSMYNGAAAGLDARDAADAVTAAADQQASAAMSSSILANETAANSAAAATDDSDGDGGDDDPANAPDPNAVQGNTMF